MKHFRTTLIALVSWLFIFYNIERIHEPLNIASFVYVLSAGGAVLLIYWRPVTSTLANYLFALCFVLLLVLKNQWGYPILGTALPITITETVALALTFTLALRLAQGVSRFEEGAAELATVGRWDDLDFDSNQSAMYREVRRARRFERPLAMIYLNGDIKDANTTLHEMIERSQQEAIKRFASIKIGEAIEDNLRDCDLLARRDDGFFVLMPETQLEEAGGLAEKIGDAIQERFNVQLNCGVVSFPDQEVTFSGLLERAVSSATGQPLLSSTDTSKPSTPEVQVATNVRD